MGIASIGRAGLLLIVIPVLHADDYPVVTVCEVLHDLVFYNGKTLIVVGKKSATMEGSWLVQDCPARLATNGGWGHDLSLTYVGEWTKTPPTLPKDLSWDDEVIMSKLMEVKATTKLNIVDRGEYLYEDQWVVVFGRLDTMIPLQNEPVPGGRPIREGFGHLNGSQAQLVAPEGGTHGFPSAGWRLDRKPISHVPAPYRFLQRTLWMRVRAVLTSDEGMAYFESSMKNALMPGGAEGVGKFRGRVISSSPELWPETIVLAVSGPVTPDVTLKLDKPWRIGIPPGTTIEFEGIAIGYTRSPFMVTFAVTTTQLSIAARQ